MELIDKFKELEAKQKVTLGVTLVLLVFVLYYGYNTFFGGTSFTSSTPPPAASRVAERSTTPSVPRRTTTAIAPAVPNRTVQTTSAPPVQTSMNTTGATASISIGNATVQTTAAKPGPTVRDGIEEVPTHQPDLEQLKMLQESEAVQQEYLSLVNKYQLIQLQQKVAQAENTLASSKLQSAQIQSQTQDLTTQLKSSSVSQASLAQQDQAKHRSAFQDLTVMYVAKQQGRWTAMLSASGNYFEVKVGTRLPDGSVVSRIDDRGVILSRDGSRRPVTIAKTLN